MHTYMWSRLIIGRQENDLGPRRVSGRPARLPKCESHTSFSTACTNPRSLDLQFKPDIAYWLDPAHTYRVIFIQSQASWFVLTGRDFTVDAHNAGGIAGNGQAWWSFFANRTRADGDGRPVALTLSNVTRGTVRDFRVEGQPFWCNAVADSREVVYDGMHCNATNADPVWAGQK